MKLKNIIIAAIIILTALASPFDSKVFAQGGDPCGGTGGNGEITSIGSNSFTLKLNEGSNKGSGNLIVTMNSGARVETSNGPASVADLKIGDRVTLVGDNHRDGTFAADAVALCSGASNATTTQAAAIAVRNTNPDFNRINTVLTVSIWLIIGLVWLGSVAFLLFKKRKGFVYLLFFTIFYVYLFKVLDYTVLQFQSLLLLQHFLPSLMLNGYEDGTNVNFIPLITLTREDIQTSLLNIVMMLPFGFGLPFITIWRFKKVVLTGLIVSIAIELLQLITGFMANTTFRVADINDLVFNTLGVVIGFILFVAFVRAYRRMSRNWKIRTNPILRYIAERPQVR